MSIRRSGSGIWIALLILSSTLSIKAQDMIEYKPHIHTVFGQIKNKLLLFPDRADILVSWADYEKGGDGKWVPSGIPFFDSYTVSCLNSADSSVVLQADVDSLSFVFRGMDLEQKYLMQVIGHKGGEDSQPSKLASIFTGYSAGPQDIRTPEEKSNLIYYFLIPWAQWPFQIASLFKEGTERYFTESSAIGKVAFEAIWLFFLCGMLIWIRGCMRHIKPKRIYPIRGPMDISDDEMDAPEYRHETGPEKSEKKRFIQINFSRSGKGDDLDINKEIVSIVKIWKRLIRRLNIKRRNYLLNNVSANQEKLAEIYTDYWAKDGGYQEVHDLILKIESNEKLKENPTAKLILAGLRNHEIGGLDPASVSIDVDRAIENRASVEIATLRRKSYLDWLWNFGTLAPIMGLLGTATGISLTFADLKKSGTEIDIQALSAGINEALWTTIGGLLTGIVLMLIYYWYDNKLSEIYSKWEYLYVDISEGL